MLSKYEEETSRNKQLLSLKLCTVLGSLGKSLVPSQGSMMSPTSGHLGYDSPCGNNNPSRWVHFGLCCGKWFTHKHWILSPHHRKKVSTEQWDVLSHSKMTRMLSGEKLLYSPHFMTGSRCQFSLRLIYQLNFILSLYIQKKTRSVLCLALATISGSHWGSWEACPTGKAGAPYTSHISLYNLPSWRLSPMCVGASMNPLLYSQSLGKYFDMSRI